MTCTSHNYLHHYLGGLYTRSNYVGNERVTNTQRVPITDTNVIPRISPEVTENENMPAGEEGVRNASQKTKLEDIKCCIRVFNNFLEFMTLIV